jgi:hypothetical protein
VKLAAQYTFHPDQDNEISIGRELHYLSCPVVENDICFHTLAAKAAVRQVLYKRPKLYAADFLAKVGVCGFANEKERRRMTAKACGMASH